MKQIIKILFASIITVLVWMKKVNIEIHRNIYYGNSGKYLMKGIIKFYLLQWLLFLCQMIKVNKEIYRKIYSGNSWKYFMKHDNQTAQLMRLRICRLYSLQKYKPTTTKSLCSRYDNKLHTKVRLQFWRSAECGITPLLPILPGPF